MMEAPRETRVLGAVVTLVDSLLADFDVVDLLTDLTEQCAHLLDVEAAGLLLAGPRLELHLMAATSANSRDLELFQLQADEGPCLDCFTTGQPVSAPELQDERPRWPRFIAAATDAGFASVHAVPMRAADTVMGALGLFGTQRGSLNEADLLVARTLAHVASVALLQEHPPTPLTVMPQLQAALAERVVVDQASGFVSERLDVSVGDAFGLLRHYARARAEHLSDVARLLIHEPDQRDGILSVMSSFTASS